MKSPILFDNKEECCGCAACFTVCPRQAISMVADEEGFDYPRIDRIKCVSCKICVKLCPLFRLNVMKFS